MRFGLLPVASLLLLIATVAIGWAMFGVLRALHSGGRLPRLQAVVLLACCTAVWITSCLVFMAVASLGGWPTSDGVWYACAATFVLLIGAPVALVWTVHQRATRQTHQ